MTTNVPSPTFGTNGFVIPAESAILAGRQADLNAAFGGNLNPALNTRQGQIAQTDTAIIGDANNQFLALANGIDPAYASGRMQDAIGRIYLLTRYPALPTTVWANCVGISGTVIPQYAKAIDVDQNVYYAVTGGTIPSGGTISLQFACSVTGPTPLAPGALNIIYKQVNGWDSISNPLAGVVGNVVESRSEFEFRRQNSVASNAQGSPQAIQGAVLGVSGVTDAYVLENPLSVTSGASFTGSINGTTLTASSVTGKIAVGQTIVGSGVLQSTVITSLGTGTGGAGNYGINQVQSIGPISMISAFGGVQLAPNSIYVAAYGGNPQAIGNAIFSKKNGGCNYNGNTTVTVVDNSSIYSSPYPSYEVTFESLPATPVYFSISIQRNANTPTNAVSLIQQAVTQSFYGNDNGPAARAGSWLLASRFYSNIIALGSWVSVYNILLGVGSPNQPSVLMQINQEPTIGTINVTIS